MDGDTGKKKTAGTCNSHHFLSPVRGVLGVLVCLSFVAFRRAVQSTLGDVTSSLLTLITCSQFHFLFYASRPLPNTFALIPTLLSFRFWLLGQHGPFIWSSAAAIIVFRAELSILLGVMLLVGMYRKRCGVWKVLRHSIPASLTWIGTCVYMCQRHCAGLHKGFFLGGLLKCMARYKNVWHGTSF